MNHIDFLLTLILNRKFQLQFFVAALRSIFVRINTSRAPLEGSVDAHAQ